MSWYSRPGDSNATQFNQNPNPKSLFTFYLKSGEKKSLIFLDDQQFKVWETKIQVNGNWQRFTANINDPEDPLVLAAAEKKIYLSLVEYYTILDLTPYMGKDGKERKFSKRALAVPKSLKEALDRRRSEQGGNLSGCMFNVHRDGDKSPACGNDYAFVKKVDIAKEIEAGKLTADVAKPFDFMEMLKPANPAVVRAALMASGKAAAPKTVSRDSLSSDPFGSEEPALETSSSEDIPF